MKLKFWTNKDFFHVQLGLMLCRALPGVMIEPDNNPCTCLEINRCGQYMCSQKKKRKEKEVALENLL